MSRTILLFGGTTEGRQIADAVRDKSVTLCVSVATEYGESLLEKADNIRVMHGRKGEDEIEKLIRDTGAELVIDATHPYATEVTQAVKTAAQATNTEYVRVSRCESGTKSDRAVYADDTEAAVRYLNTESGNVLLTVGSKELYKYTSVTDWQNRIYARILPLPEAVETAVSLGFTGNHLICMQGPFSEEINAAMLRMLDIRCMVTKDTGAAGGFPEKLSACAKRGVTPLVIKRPDDESGCSAEECIAMLSERFGLNITKGGVTIIGAGAGDGKYLVPAAKSAVERADLIIGAKRLTDALSPFGREARVAVSSEEIEKIIRENADKQIVVVMSGDTGFFSGTKSLVKRIADLPVQILPGISSVSYFAAKTGISWDDACIVSVHGRKCNYVSKVMRHVKTVILSGGERGVNDILHTLCEYNLGDCEVYIGDNLSYESERITQGTAHELKNGTYSPLSLVIVINNNADSAVVTGGMSDDEFIRGEVPMTKQEVRAVTLAKLKLCRNSVCWDVGAGTGSVSVEMARAAEDGTVYAIERNEEACSLIRANSTEAGVMNVEVIGASAPECLAELPAPTHVFIGGSGGGMRDIMRAALDKNSGVRIVINTVTAESFCDAVSAAKSLPVTDTEITEICVSRSREVGAYHMMTAQNPVYIISCRGKGDE